MEDRANAPQLTPVRSVATDLVLFWTLRTASDSDLPRWIVPVPAEDAEDPAVLDALAELVRP